MAPLNFIFKYAFLAFSITKSLEHLQNANIKNNIDNNVIIMNAKIIVYMLSSTLTEVNPDFFKFAGIY
jgi:hypothetical protein